MPFNIGEFVNGLADALLKYPAVGSVARNPLLAALVIAGVTVVLIWLFMYTVCEEPDSFTRSNLRCGFWCFVAAAGILFMQNKLLFRELELADRDSKFDEVFGAAEDDTPILNMGELTTDGVEVVARKVVPTLEDAHVPTVFDPIYAGPSVAG